MNDILGTGHSRLRMNSKDKEDCPSKQPVLSSSSDDSECEKRELSCICGQKDDDGEEMVRCDQCLLRWEHVDCIFPKTKKRPFGNYFCHVCKPRPTDITREQARAYQDRVKMEKDEAKNQELKRKLAERARRKEENSRKPSSVVRSTPKASVPLKSEKSGNSSYREILKNVCSTSARRLIAISHLPFKHSSGVDIVNTLRNNPIIGSLYVEAKVFGIVVTEEVCEGAYIAELLGYVSLTKECPNRDVVPGSLNDHTFLFEMGQDKIIIDARKCGNITKNLRRSCKPNAELEAIKCGTHLVHIMIKATQNLEMHDEVSIKLEEDWMNKPRPAQGCGCDKFKKKNECELEQYFAKANNNASSSRKSLPANGVTRKKIANDDSAKEQSVAKSKELLSKKRDTAAVDSGEPMEGRQKDKRARMEDDESREERKLLADIERIERQNKKSGSKPRGRPPASCYASTKEEKKGKERDDKIPSSGRRRRKTEIEDEDGDTGRISAMISTSMPSSRKRLSAGEGRKEEASSPVPSLSTSLVSLTHSIVSPMTDDTTRMPSLPASGKNELLLRCQEVEKEKEKAAAIGRAIESSSIVPPSSTRVPDVSTPMEKEKTVKKSAVSYEEFKKRQKEGKIISGEEKKDRNEKKEEAAKNGLMPRVDSSKIANDDSASEQPVETIAMSKDRLSMKRETTAVDSGEPMEGQQAEKRARVEDDESMSDPLPPPASPPPSSAHSAIIAEPPSPSTPHSGEVEKLREELAKSQDMYQRACCVAKKEQDRAERAETLLDTKPPREITEWNRLKKGLEERLADITMQLDAARGNADKLHAEKQEVDRENDSLKVKLVKAENRVEDADRVIANLSTKITEVKEELETAGIAAQAPTANELDLAQEIAALKEELKASAAKVAEIDNIRDERAEEIASLNKKLDMTEKKETIANELNDVLTRKNLLLEEELTEMKKEKEKAKKR